MYYSGSDYAWKSAIRSTKASEDFEKQLDELEGSDEYKLNGRRTRISIRQSRTSSRPSSRDSQ